MESIQVNSFSITTEEEFTLIYDEWYGRLCYFAFLILKDKERSEDLVQDCFVRLWKREKKLQGILSIKAFLYRSVHNACMTELQTKKNNLTMCVVLPVEETVIPIDSIIIKAELYGKLYDAIERIPEKFAEVIKLYYLEGKRLEEIARLLNIPLYTVKSRKHRGIVYLRKHMPDAMIALMLLSTALD